MSWPRSIVREVFGLFVDDGSVALAIVVWLAVAWLATRLMVLATPWTGLALFGGLAAILLASVLRRAGR